MSILFAPIFLAGLQSTSLAQPVAPPPRAAPSTAAARVTLFERVWAMVDAAFYDPRFNGADWAAARLRYRGEVAAAPDDRAAAIVIRRMLSELRTSHVDFYNLSDLAPSPQATTAPAVSWRQERRNVGIIRVTRFDKGQLERDRLDRAFAELDLSGGLILDLRGNPGGDLSLGMRLADHLLPTKRPISLFATRAGLLKAGVPSIDRLDRAAATPFDGYDIDAFQAALRQQGAVMLMSGGRARTRAPRRVVVLIDRQSASAAEGTAGSLKSAGAIVIGERSAGAMLSSATFPVGGGWVLRLPVADHLTPDGRRLEGTGVQPDFAVPSASAMTTALRLLARRGMQD